MGKSKQSKMRQLIKEILKEETSLKKKLEDVVEKMGLIKGIKSVGGIENFSKIMGYESDQIDDMFKQFLTKNTFTQNDINSFSKIYGWTDGATITFTFDEVNFEYVDDELGIETSVVILDGTYYDHDTEEYVRFSSGDNPFEDFSQFFEFKDYVQETIAEFVSNLYKKLNPSIGDNIWVNVEW
jgi:hypothetical protein